MPVSRAVSIASLLAVGFAAHSALAADRLILRNLDVVFDRTVVSFDEDGVVLDGPRPGAGNRLTWDEVERGKVALDQQRFDRLLQELGAPLYRIRQRLKNGDYAAAGHPAESLYSKYSERKSQTAYLMCQSVMWSRLAAGQREAAVEPFLRCFELLRSRAAISGNLPGRRRLQVDAATAVSAELPPVWFDAAAAKQELPKVQVAIRALSQPRPEGAYVYYASLAIAAGELAEAERVLPLLVTDEMVWWRKLIEAEAELRPALISVAANKMEDPHPNPLSDGTGPAETLFRRLSQMQDDLPVVCRPTGLLLQGLAGIQSQKEDDARGGLLALLSLPARYAGQQPELAAAGLYYAAGTLDKLKDGRGALAVRQELSSRFSATYFGRLAREKMPR